MGNRPEATRSFGAQVKLRHLLLLLLLTSIAGGVLAMALGLDLAAPTVVAVLLLVSFQLPTLLWIRSRLALAGLTLRTYVGPAPERRPWLLWTLLVVSLLMLAVADGALSGAAVRALDPDRFERWFLEAASPARPYGPAGRTIAAAALFVTLVVGGPVVEEVLFRGLLVDVWTRRWTRGRAWIGSGLLFGVLHFPYVGQRTLFALVQSAARSASGSLVLPIGLHVANNLVAMGTAIGPLVGRGQLPGTSELPGVGTGLVLLAVSLPVPLYVVVRGFRADAEARRS